MLCRRVLTPLLVAMVCAATSGCASKSYSPWATAAHCESAPYVYPDAKPVPEYYTPGLDQVPGSYPLPGNSFPQEGGFEGEVPPGPVFDSGSALQGAAHDAVTDPVEMQQSLVPAYPSRGKVYKPFGGERVSFGQISDEHVMVPSSPQSDRESNVARPWETTKTLRIRESVPATVAPIPLEKRIAQSPANPQDNERSLIVLGAPEFNEMFIAENIQAKSPDEDLPEWHRTTINSPVPAVANTNPFESTESNATGQQGRNPFEDATRMIGDASSQIVTAQASEDAEPENATKAWPVGNPFDASQLIPNSGWTPPRPMHQPMDVKKLQPLQRHDADITPNPLFSP